MKISTPAKPQSADQLFGLAARRAVPDGERLGFLYFAASVSGVSAASA